MSKQKYRFFGGNIITEVGVEQKDVLVTDGKIRSFVSRDAVTEDYEVIDCSGLYVSAGFVDIHQHGGGGADYMDGKANTYLDATEAHLSHGTTSVMPTLLSADRAALLRAIECYKHAKCDRRIRANLLGLHLEGPYISPAQAGAQKPEHIRIFDRDEYTYITEAAEGHIKRWSVAPEVEGAKEFAEYASANGIALSIAHSNADLDTVMRSYEWGYHHVTHFYSCVSTITRRDGFRIPGILEAAYLIDGMDVEVIADGCHLPHSLLAYVAKFKSHDRIALVTDAMRAAGQEVAESFLGSPDDPLPAIIEDGVAKLTDRSGFAGSIATADRLVRNMVQSGVTLVDAVRMVTVNPIRMMGLNVRKGRLVPDYDADICVFDENINIKTVICNGKIAFSS